MKPGHSGLASQSSFDSLRNHAQLCPESADAGYSFPANVLLIEDDPVTALSIQDAFAGSEGSSFCIDTTARFSLARERPCMRSIDVVLLGLGPEDRDSLDALEQVLQFAPTAVVLVLCNTGEEDLARVAIQHGAHDYLVKSHIDAYWWPRVLRYIIESRRARKSTELVLLAAEDALFEERERALVTLNSIGDAVLATDLAGNVTYLNQVAETMTGWSREEALGQPLECVFRVIDSTTSLVVTNPAWRAIQENRTVGLAMASVLVRRDGSEAPIEDSAAPIHNREGHVTGAVIVFHDVSQSKAMTVTMAHLAQHDFLTGLPNRALLMERLLQSIGLAHRHGT